MQFVQIYAVYAGNNGAATISLYERLKAHGRRGEIAMNLFRACKASERAKVYRGGNGHGSYKAQAYQKKAWSLAQLCDALNASPVDGVAFGWGLDRAAVGFEHVLYVDIPTGQVSFHSPMRGVGPDYPREWDGIKQQGPTRICRWIAEITLDDVPWGQ